MRTLVNKNYNHFLHLLLDSPKKYGETRINHLYNAKRMRSLGGSPNKTAYEGYLKCGAMSFLFKNELPFETQPYIRTIKRCSRKDDHVFLKHGDIILDPTYRQMFRTDHGVGNEEYFKFLYESCPPFFVGRYEELEEISNVLKQLHRKDFGVDATPRLHFYNMAKEHQFSLNH